MWRLPQLAETFVLWLLTSAFLYRVPVTHSLRYKAGLEAEETQILHTRDSIREREDGGNDMSRALLTLPMSRRERLQLSNKERARTERRARARKRRENLLDKDELLELQQEDRRQGRDKARRPNARRAKGHGTEQRLSLVAAAAARLHEALPVHAFAEDGGQGIAETGVEDAGASNVVAARESGEGMFGSHDETQSGAFDAGSSVSQDKRLDNLSTQQSGQGKEGSSVTQRSRQADGNEAASFMAQDTAVGADLPADLGGEHRRSTEEVIADSIEPEVRKQAKERVSTGAAAQHGSDVFSKAVIQKQSGQVAQTTADHLPDTGIVGSMAASQAGNSSAGSDAFLNIELTKIQASHTSILGVSEEEWRRRQGMVVQACKETWAVYSKYAMGSDELAPVSLKGKNPFGNLGAMIVDSLDTLWMFGLKEEFQEAQQWVASSLNLEQVAIVSFFESTIRLVGGLLSAFELSKEPTFLQKAQQMTDKLMIACKDGFVLCNNEVHMNDQHWHDVLAGYGKMSMLAEFASLQMEFKTLSHLTQDPKYALKADNMIKPLDAAFQDVGLLPLEFYQDTGKPLSTNASMLTMGAMADSAYEYFLKTWLLTGKKEEMYRRRWELAIDEATAKLVGTNEHGLTFVTTVWNNGGDVPLKHFTMEHLTCFLPGNIALGVMEQAVSGAKAMQYMQLAEKLTYACWQMYERTVSGLAGEVVNFKEDDLPIVSSVSVNRLRPETVESFFYLWRATGNAEYRDWGWQVFQAFQNHSRTPEGAYSSAWDLNTLPVKKTDTMESFWTAETLKYLWLLFGEEKSLSLSEWVLNTEAHPFRIFIVDQELDS